MLSLLRWPAGDRKGEPLSGRAHGGLAVSVRVAAWIITACSLHLLLYLKHCKMQLTPLSLGASRSFQSCPFTLVNAPLPFCWKLLWRGRVAWSGASSLFLSLDGLLGPPTCTGHVCSGVAISTASGASCSSRGVLCGAKPSGNRPDTAVSARSRDRPSLA